MKYDPKTWCSYCSSATECRGSAWTTSGSDLERFERNHNEHRRGDLRLARQQAAERRAAQEDMQ